MSYSYNWYHHFALDDDEMEYINDVILSHKWEEFLRIKQALAEKFDYQFFPMKVWDNDRNQYVNLTETRFNWIFETECECG